MSIWQSVGDYYDSATGYVSGKIEGVQEWWTGDDEEQAAAEATGIPGANDQTGGPGQGPQGTPLGGGMNWTAIGTIVSVAALAAKFIR